MLLMSLVTPFCTLVLLNPDPPPAFHNAERGSIESTFHYRFQVRLMVRHLGDKLIAFTGQKPTK